MFISKSFKSSLIKFNRYSISTLLIITTASVRCIFSCVHSAIYEFKICLDSSQRRIEAGGYLCFDTCCLRLIVTRYQDILYNITKNRTPSSLSTENFCSERLYYYSPICNFPETHSVVISRNKESSNCRKY